MHRSQASIVQPRSVPSYHSASNTTSLPHSTSSKSHAYYSSLSGASSSMHSQQKSSAYERSHTVVSPPDYSCLSGDRLNQTFKLVSSEYHLEEDQGEDSDCYTESTPGRAWKKSSHAHPRTRISGFDTSAQYASVQHGSAQQSRSSAERAPKHNYDHTSKPLRQDATLASAGFLPYQNSKTTSDRSRTADNSCYTKTHCRQGDTSSRGLDVYHQNTARGGLQRY